MVTIRNVNKNAPIIAPAKILPVFLYVTTQTAEVSKNMTIDIGMKVPK
jgi:hypothetical protein